MGILPNLDALPPAEAGKKYVEFMGGAASLLSKAKKSYDAGEYRWVAQVVNHLVFADPKNKNARNLLADAYEQLGYQASWAPWRNFYLSGAKELREGVNVLTVTQYCWSGHTGRVCQLLCSLIIWRCDSR